MSSPCQRLLITIGIALLVVSISLTQMLDTRDPATIMFRMYFRYKVNQYIHGSVRDRLDRPISSEASTYEDILRSNVFQPSAGATEAETLTTIRDNIRIKYVLPNPANCYRDRNLVNGNVTIQWHILGDGINNKTDAPTIFYMHGGAFVRGSLLTHSGFMCHISRQSHVRVLGFDYRKAPEYPMPAAIDDAEYVYTWLLDHIKVKPENIIFMGDSAGGGGVLLLAQRLINKRQASRLPAGIVAFSPWTDLSMSSPSWSSNLPVDDMMGSSGLLTWASSRAVGGDLIPKSQQLSLNDPTISSLFGIYAGLPPLYINVGGDEILLDDSRLFAQYARDAGVNVHFTIGPYMEHVYTVGGAALMPEAQAELNAVMTWIHKRLQQ